eukprot:SAG31_NODE_4328_length_3351_cov_1.759225_1_plen_73_part_10
MLCVRLQTLPVCKLANIVWQITMVDISVLGSIHWWGLEVNAISIINLVMAVGLVVDYSVHIIHNFGMQRQAPT